MTGFLTPRSPDYDLAQLRRDVEALKRRAVGEGGGGCDEGPWHNFGDEDEPTYEGDWAQDGDDPTRFRTVCDEVELEIRATGTPGTVLGILPDGFRPIIPTPPEPYADGTATGVINVWIDVDGTINVI